MRRIGSTNAGCLVTSSTRSPSRYTARPSRRLATYASPPRMSAPTLPQAANNDKPRAALYLRLTLGGLFPLGYLVYGAAVLELGRDAGIDLAERWILTPLGISAIAGLVGLLLVAARRRA